MEEEYCFGGESTLKLFSKGRFLNEKLNFDCNLKFTVVKNATFS
jgi:hypothetical protein